MCCTWSKFLSVFQSTPPHGGRRQSARCAGDRLAVSIHAPAWGATMNTACNGQSATFQSTPPHGGRPSIAAARSAAASAFQSTPPHGGRRGRLRSRRKFLLFQSTPPHGGRPLKAVLGYYPDMFQSTPPHGGRLLFDLHSKEAGVCFNPRPRMGGDALAVILRDDRHAVSIHAPAWGATSNTSPSGGWARKFQSTPPHGGRPSRNLHNFSWYLCFNPRPRMGGDATSLTGNCTPSTFQSTPPHGGRRNAYLAQEGVCFNPRPRMGGDQF